MKILIPGSNGLYINRSLVVCDCDGNVCEPLPSGDLYLWLFDRWVCKPVEWLWCVTYCGLKTLAQQENVEFIKQRDRVQGFPYYVRQLTPVYWEKDPRYRISGRYPTIAVNTVGDCVNVLNGKRLAKYAAKHDTRRRFVCVPRSELEYFGGKSAVVARVLLYAWVINDRPDVASEVNHIDGDPSHDALSNLEWVTPHENRVHATNAGLRTDNKPCKLYDVLEGIEYGFVSLSEARRFIFDKTGVPNTLLVPPNKVDRLIARRFEFRFRDDNTPWLRAQSHRGSASGGRYLITLRVGPDTVVYSGLKALVKDFKLWNMHLHGGLNISAILARLVKDHPNVTVLSVVDQYRSNMLEVLDTDTGTVDVYPTVRAAMEATGVGISSIGNSRKSGGAVRYQKRYCFRDLPGTPEEPWPAHNDVPGPNRIIITDHNTGKSSAYRSVREACKVTGYTKDFIRYRLQVGRAIGGISVLPE